MKNPTVQDVIAVAGKAAIEEAALRIATAVTRLDDRSRAGWQNARDRLATDFISPILESLVRKVATAVNDERQRCLADVCAECRADRPAIRLQSYAFDQADGFFQHPTVTTLWVHEDRVAGKFVDCAGASIRERGRS